MSREIKDIIRFNKPTGLNSDTDIDNISNGDSPVDTTKQTDGRLNLIHQEGNLSVLTNSYGNSEESHSLPAGTNKVIGTCEDKENNAIIYFVYNSNNNHSIVRYNFDGTFDDISTNESAWAFTSDMEIDNARIIGEGDNAQLIWSDGTNPPRNININNVETGAYSSLGINNINLDKPAPVDVVTVEFNDDDTYPNNYIAGRLFQFAFRYVYTTGENSAWSKWSGLQYSYETSTDDFVSSNEKPIGTFNRFKTTNNRLELTIPVAYDNVDCVILAFRDQAGDSDEFSVWKFYDNIEVSQGDNTYYFYNDKISGGLDQEEFFINYYDVPRKADSIEVLNENRVALGGVTKDFDNIALDVRLTEIRKDTFTDLRGSGVDQVTAISGGGTADIKPDFNGSYDYYNAIYITNNGPDNFDKYYISTNEPFADAEAVVDQFVLDINAKPPTPLISASKVGFDTVRITNNDSFDVTVTHVFSTSTPKLGTQTAGAKHLYALAYYENYNKSGRSLISDSTTLDVYPYGVTQIDDATYGLVGDYNKEMANDITRVQFQINHNPPSWANYYQWLYGGNTITQSFCVIAEINKDTGVYDEYLNKIELQECILQHDGVVQGLFDVRSGDKVRVVQAISALGDVTQNEEVDELDVVDVIDGVNGTVIVDNWKDIAIGDLLEGNTSDTHVVLQFYRESKLGSADNVVYREIGDVLPVVGGYHETNSNRYYGVQSSLTLNGNHSAGATSIAVNGIVVGSRGSSVVIEHTGGSYEKYVYTYMGIDSGDLIIDPPLVEDATSGDSVTITIGGADSQDQTASQEAIGLMNFCDIIKTETYRRVYETDEAPILLTTIAESKNYNTITGGAFDNFGRVNFVDDDFKERKYNAIVWGGTYSGEGLVFNELNRFLDKDFITLDDKWGDIAAMREEGYTLNAVQRNKLTVIDVGRTTQVLPDGSEQYLGTTAVLGSKRPINGEYGTIFPLSVIKNDRNVYFFDIYAGKVIRKSPNGIEVISDYGMDKFFDERSKQLLDSGIANLTCLASYDKVLEMYYLTCMDSNDSTNDFTIGFHEPTNRWLSFYSFLPEAYAMLGHTKFISFNNGSLYLHNEASADRNKFYGVDYQSEIKVVSNAENALIKRFDNISLNTNDIWEAPDNDSILVGSDAITFTDPDEYTVHRGAMQSKLTEAMFTYYENEYRSDFKRDMTTASTTPSMLDLVNGRALRGKHLIINLENDNTNEVHLRTITISSSVSRGN